MAVAGRLLAEEVYPSFKSGHLVGKRWTLFDQFLRIHEPEPVRKTVIVRTTLIHQGYKILLTCITS